jgi:hypothetical protein
MRQRLRKFELVQEKHYKILDRLQHLLEYQETRRKYEQDQEQLRAKQEKEQRGKETELRLKRSCWKKCWDFLCEHHISIILFFYFLVSATQNVLPLINSQPSSSSIPVGERNCTDIPTFNSTSQIKNLNNTVEGFCWAIGNKTFIEEGKISCEAKSIMGPGFEAFIGVSKSALDTYYLRLGSIIPKK